MDARVLPGLALAVAVTVTACGASAEQGVSAASRSPRSTAPAQALARGRTAASTASSGTGAVAVAPPHSPGPCADDDPPGLDGLRSQSDIAVVGHVSHAPFRTVSFGSYYTVNVSEVVESRLTGPPPATLAMLVDGPVVPDLFPDGEYVAFLFADRPLRAVDPSLGRPSYQASDGWLGLFPVREGRVYPECPAAQSMPKDPTGVRPGELVTAFVGRLRSRPQPRYGRRPARG